MSNNQPLEYSTVNAVQMVAKPAYPPSATAWWLVVVLFSGALISYTHRLVLGVLVEPLGSDLGLSDTQISVLQGAAFAVIYAVAGLPIGRLADHGRRKRLAIIGSVIWCSGTLLCGLAPDFWTIFAARCLVGIGEATLAPAAASMISDSFPPHRRGTALGVFLTGTVLGGPAAIALGGLILSDAAAGAYAGLPIVGVLAPWRIVLVLIALGSFMLPMLLITVREPTRKHGQERAEVPDFRWVLRAWRLLLPLLFALAFLSVGDYALFSWAPTAIIRQFHWTPDRIGVAFGLIASLAGVAGALSGGVLSDIVARSYGDRARLILTAGAALVGAAAMLLFTLGNAAFALAGVGIWGLASAIGAISGISALQALLPNELRGVGMALVAFFNTLLGLGLGPTAVAMASDSYGSANDTSQAIAMVVTPIAIAAAFFAVRARRGTVPDI